MEQKTDAKQSVPEDKKEQKEDASHFDCKICMCTSNEPIVTHCGHLFCWACLYQWSVSRKSEKIPCPVCNNSVSINDIIPLYASQENHKKKYEDVPNRPRPRAHEPFNNIRNDMNFQFNFNGFGWNWGAGNLEGRNHPTWKRILSLLPVLVFLFAPSVIELISKFFENQMGPRVVYVVDKQQIPDVFGEQQFYFDHGGFEEFESFGIVGVLTIMFLFLAMVIIVKQRR